ncbi:MAG TPA: RNA polymerase sigma factor [Edaphobacter sp.]|nr:RNA polymerase sigma factor [Edaphobacter sp.]
MPMHKTDALAARLSWTDEEDAALAATASMDEREFQSLYDATAQPILAYLTGVTGRRDVAEDVLQETYCRFLVRQPGAMETTEARRYLFRIATNLLRDRWRRGEDTPAPELADEGSSPDVNLQIDVRRAMQAMKPRERELLWLAYVEGMSHAEIAAATGLGAMSVRLLLYRARRRAAALLWGEGTSDESKPM